MPKIQIPKQIRVEDFSSDFKELIEKIGFVFNPFANEVYNSLDGRLDFTNMNRELITVDVTISATGTLVNVPKIKTNLKSKARGINVVNAVNLVNSTIYPTSAPYVSFESENTMVSILNVSGLQNNSQYRLTLEIIA